MFTTESIPTATADLYDFLGIGVASGSGVFAPSDSAIFFGSPVIPTEAAETATHLFHSLTKQWLDDTAFTSSMNRIIESDPYQEIIELGAALQTTVVRLILEDLRSSPKHWFYALYVITGADPIPDEAAGNLEGMTAAWLDWGRANGYID